MPATVCVLHCVLVKWGVALLGATLLFPVLVHGQDSQGAQYQGPSTGSQAQKGLASLDLKKPSRTTASMSLDIGRHCEDLTISRSGGRNQNVSVEWTTAVDVATE
jgi:hypothetical protein